MPVHGRKEKILRKLNDEKKLSIIAVLLCILQIASAEAPELRNKLPTEWLHMEKLGEAESESLGCNDELYKYMQSSGYVRYLKNDYSESFSSSSVFFREIIGEDEFYWQVAFPEVKYQLQRPAAVIGLYYKKNDGLIFCGGILSDFCVTVVAQGTEDQGFQYRADTFQIIKQREGAKGVIAYTNCTGLNDDFSYRAIMKGAVQGYTEAKYYLFDSSLNLDESKAIRINASDFLWDEKNPLHYSLQNAFDGNPATSYVENTEDDLFEIEIHIRQYNPMFAVINGYSLTKEIYKANNRIKLFNYNYSLEDDNLDYQIINGQGNAYFKVKDLYKGKKYNDSCIAELNVKFDKSLWLFGDIDE